MPKRINPIYSVRENPDYTIWRQMKQRCFNPKNPRYERYGGRGITVCDRWKNSFESFIADMGPRPEPRHLYSLDRYPDVNGNYGPGNCRWATTKEQNRNKSNSKFSDYKGVALNLADISELTGIRNSTLAYRFRKGLRGDNLLSKPTERHIYTFRGKSYTLTELSKLSGRSKSVLRSRILKYGFTIEEAITKPHGWVKCSNYRSRPRKKPSVSREDVIEYENNSVSLSTLSELTNIDINVVLYRARKLKDKDWICNKNNNRIYLYKGCWYTLTELSIISGIRIGTLHARLTKHKWTVEKAMMDI